MTGRRSVLALLAAAGLLSACTKTKDEKKTIPQAEGEITEENPLGVAATAELEVILFSGGYGTQFATGAHIPAYKAEFPRSNVKFASQPDIASLAPRFAGESVPDVINNEGPWPLNLPALIANDQVADLTDLLKAKAVGFPGKTVAETLAPGVIEQGTFNGKVYALNYAYVVYGLWYSGKLFRDRGWTAPATWAEFVALLDRMKEAGLIPYAYGGLDGADNQIQAIMTTAAKIGGEAVLRNLDNLAEGAWRQEAVKQSVALWADIGHRYLDKSHLALKRIQVQTLQTQGRIGFYASGSWLESEQAKVTPPGFGYTVMPLPKATETDLLPGSAILAGPGEVFFVAATGINARGGKEYLRQMLSAEGSRKFTEMTGVQTVVKGGPEGLASTTTLSKGAHTFSYRWPELYPTLATEAREAVNEMMFMSGDPGAFCDRMQRAASGLKRTTK